ncbi:hypothetical protein BDW69DRAFT_177477, partial [Aspergillus filifer]
MSRTRGLLYCWASTRLLPSFSPTCPRFCGMVQAECMAMTAGYSYCVTGTLSAVSCMMHGSARRAGCAAFQTSIAVVTC